MSEMQVHDGTITAFPTSHKLDRTNSLDRPCEHLSISNGSSVTDHTPSEA